MDLLIVSLQCIDVAVTRSVGCMSVCVLGTRVSCAVQIRLGWSLYRLGGMTHTPMRLMNHVLDGVLIPNPRRGHFEGMCASPL